MAVPAVVQPASWLMGWIIGPARYIVKILALDRILSNRYRSRMDAIDTPTVLSPIAALRCVGHHESNDTWVYTLPPPPDEKMLERIAKQEADRERAVAILGDRNIVHPSNRVIHILRREVKPESRPIPNFLKVIK